MMPWPFSKPAGSITAEPGLEAGDIVAPGVVILIEHGDLRVGLRLQEIVAVDRALGLVVRLPAHAPGKLLVVAPECRAGGLEELRHLLLVEVFAHDHAGRRAQARED